MLSHHCSCLRTIKRWTGGCLQNESYARDVEGGWRVLGQFQKHTRDRRRAPGEGGTGWPCINRRSSYCTVTQWAGIYTKKCLGTVFAIRIRWMVACKMRILVKTTNPRDTKQRHALHESHLALLLQSLTAVTHCLLTRAVGTGGISVKYPRKSAEIFFSRYKPRLIFVISNNILPKY